MGNFERLRLLWLKDRVVDSRVLYAGAGFSPVGWLSVDRENYPLQEMLRYRNGDALAAATTNEDDPSAVHVPEKEWWNYRSVKLTQYRRVPARDIQSDLRIKSTGGANIGEMRRSRFPAAPRSKTLKCASVMFPDRLSFSDCRARTRGISLNRKSDNYYTHESLYTT